MCQERGCVRDGWRVCDVMNTYLDRIRQGDAGWRRIIGVVADYWVCRW